MTVTVTVTVRVTVRVSRQSRAGRREHRGRSAAAQSRVERAEHPPQVASPPRCSCRRRSDSAGSAPRRRRERAEEPSEVTVSAVRPARWTRSTQLQPAQRRVAAQHERSAARTRRVALLRPPATTSSAAAAAAVGGSGGARARTCGRRRLVRTPTDRRRERRSRRRGVHDRTRHAEHTAAVARRVVDGVRAAAQCTGMDGVSGWCGR